jgi:hypothetical protein
LFNDRIRIEVLPWMRIHRESAPGYRTTSMKAEPTRGVIIFDEKVLNQARLRR